MMKSHLPLTVMLALGCLLRVAESRAAVIAGQIDNFESGTTLNWANGGGGGTPQPLNISTGGPAGVNDNFLEATADGSGAGGKLTVFNRSQWIGDYVDQGINEIDMDLENLGASTLTIRIAFKSTTGNGAPGYLSTGISLSPSSGWHHEAFQLTAGTMTAIASPVAFSTFFTSGNAEMRIINEVGTSNLNGDNISSHLGIDNITAVPEPGSSALLILSIAAAFLFYRGKIVS